MSRQKDDPFASFTLGDDVQTGEFPVVGTQQNAAVAAIQPPPRRRPRAQRGQSARSHASSDQPQVASQGQVQGHQVQQPDPRDQQLALLREQNALLQQQMAAQTSALQQLQQQVAAQSGGSNESYSPAPASQGQVSQTYQSQPQRKEKSVAIDFDDFSDYVREGCKEVNLKKAKKSRVRSVQEAARAVIKTDHYKRHLKRYCDDHGLDFDEIHDQIELNRYLLDEFNDMQNAKDEADPLADRVKFWWASGMALAGVGIAIFWAWVFGALFLAAAAYTAWNDIAGKNKFKRGVSCALLCVLPFLAAGILSAAVEMLNSNLAAQSMYKMAKIYLSSRFSSSSKPSHSSQPPAGDQNVAPRRRAPVGAPPDLRSKPRTSSRRRPTVRRRTRRRRVARRRRVRRRRRTRRRISMRWQRNVLIRSGHWRNIGMSRKRMHTICVKAGRVSRIYVQSGGANVSVVQPTRTPGCRQSFVVVARKYGKVQVGVQGSFPVRLRLSK